MKNKSNKNILILSTIAIILFVILIFALFQNFNLRNEINELNKNMGDVFANALNDFNLFVMSKVDGCEAVTLVSDNKSVTINEVHCE